MPITQVFKQSKVLTGKSHYELTCLSLGLFYTSAYVVVNMFSRSKLSAVFTLLRYMSYVLLGILILIQICGNGSWKEKGKNLLNFFKNNLFFDVCLVISLLSCYYRRQIEPAVLLLLMLTAKYLGIRKVVEIFFKIGVVWYIATVLFSVVGILPNLQFFRDDTLRWSLGFIYPLEAHSVLYLLGLSGLYLYWDKSRWLPEVLFFAVSCLLYTATKARFSWVLTLVTCIFFLIAANLPQAGLKKIIQSRWFQIFLVIFAVAMFTLPAYLAYNFEWGNPLFAAINRLVNDRLVLGRRAFAYEPIYPFGYAIEWVGYGGSTSMRDLWETYNYVDCSYLKNMFDYGYVYLVMEFGFYLWILLSSARKGNWALMLAGISVMLLGLFEARLLQIAINPFILAAGGLLMWQPWRKKPQKSQL